MVAAKSTDAKLAAAKIMDGRTPKRIVIEGALKLSGPQITALPDDLQAGQLILSNCPNLRHLPKKLRVRRLVIDNCPEITRLPDGLACHELIAADSRLTALPDDIRIDYRLDLRNSPLLESLPKGLKLGTLNLRGCSALRELPEGLSVTFLNVEGCGRLREWPRDIQIGCGELNIAGTGYSRLPEGLSQIARLDLRNCSRIEQLPDSLDARSWIDLAGTAITRLPRASRGVQIRWRGVAINERIAFHPDTLSEQEILGERNAEVRRVMLDRVGFDWFFDRVRAEELDKDRDPGGERRLLRVSLPDDEPLVCVTLNCPSTARRYVLRVPPATASCRHAAAWLAGFDDPDDYRPLVET